MDDAQIQTESCMKCASDRDIVSSGPVKLGAPADYISLVCKNCGPFARVKSESWAPEGVTVDFSPGKFVLTTT